MNATVGDMKLQEILKQHGILAASELRRRLRDRDGMPISHAQAWNLWAGKVGMGGMMMRLLDDQLGISYEELMEVDPVPSRKKKTDQEGRIDD